MRYELSTAATASPVTITEAVDHLRVADESEYAYIQSLISMATRWVERRIERQLVTATWKLHLDAFPPEIELRKLPVASVTSITYIDADGDEQTLASTVYQTEFTSEDRPGRIKLDYGQVWPSTRSGEYNAVTVTFTCGYGAAAAVPTTIKQAILMLMNHWFDNPGAVSPITLSPVPFSVDALLSSEEWGSYA